jgi:hypothetical protein
MAKRPSRSKSSDEAAPAKPTKPRASRAKAPAPVTPPPIAAADDAPSAVAAYTENTQALPSLPASVPLDDPPGNGATTAVSMSSEPSEEDIRLRAYHKFLHRDGGPGTEFEDWIRAEQELSRKSGGDKRQLS